MGRMRAPRGERSRRRGAVRVSSWGAFPKGHYTSPGDGRRVSAGWPGRECPCLPVATPTAGGSYGEGDAKSQELGGIRSWDWVRSVEKARTGRVTQKSGTLSGGVSLPVVNFCTNKAKLLFFARTKPIVC